MLKAFRKLSPKTRLAVGIGFVSWGLVGLYLSDHAERHLGFEPSEEAKKELRSWAPSLVIVDKPSDTK
ncbi:hypothetical protein CDD81_3363 [Ophiocordyceps australis]|uniref:Uncharacterized protein n=1 Tax=Ophiocordyceps australis TaxID=1399860 RepID=A0A2C5XPY1_9HYPO|nr:hypothetical protein CDD81_3363 [Ophiocordyceps australis]